MHSCTYEYNTEARDCATGLRSDTASPVDENLGTFEDLVSMGLCGAILCKRHFRFRDHFESDKFGGFALVGRIDPPENKRLGRFSCSTRTRLIF